MSDWFLLTNVHILILHKMMFFSTLVLSYAISTLSPTLIQILVLKAMLHERQRMDPVAKEWKETKDRSAEGDKSTPCVLRGCRAAVICCSPLEDDCTPSWWIIHQSSTHRNRASSAIGLPRNVSQNVSINPPLPSLPALLALLPLFYLQNRRLLSSLNLKQHFISINCGFIIHIHIWLSRKSINCPNISSTSE